MTATFRPLEYEDVIAVNGEIVQGRGEAVPAAYPFFIKHLWGES